MRREQDEDVGGRVARAAHLLAILLASIVVALPALRAVPLLLGDGPVRWVGLAPALASALALVLVPVFLASPGRVTALLTYLAIALLPSVVAAAAGVAAPLAATLGFSVPALLLGALLGGWGLVARRDAQRALVL